MNALLAQGRTETHAVVPEMIPELRTVTWGIRRSRTQTVRKRRYDWTIVGLDWVGATLAAVRKILKLLRDVAQRGRYTANTDSTPIKRAVSLLVHRAIMRPHSRRGNRVSFTVIHQARLIPRKQAPLLEAKITTFLKTIRILPNRPVPTAFFHDRQCHRGNEECVATHSRHHFALEYSLLQMRPLQEASGRVLVFQLGTRKGIASKVKLCRLSNEWPLHSCHAVLGPLVDRILHGGARHSSLWSVSNDVGACYEYGARASVGARRVEDVIVRWLVGEFGVARRLGLHIVRSVTG